MDWQETSHHGQIVQAYRKRAGLTLKQLGQRIDCEIHTIMHYEKCVRLPDVKQRLALAVVLHIPPCLLDLPEDVIGPMDAPFARYDGFLLTTLKSDLAMRLNTYYQGSALRAGSGLAEQVAEVSRLLRESGSHDRHALLQMASLAVQLQGLIARDQADDGTAEQHFERALALAQSASCVELQALALARLASLQVGRKHGQQAEQLCVDAWELAKGKAPALRVYLALLHAEVQAMRHDRECLASLAAARKLLRYVDLADDPLLLFHATRCSEQALADGSAYCSAYLGKVADALDAYDALEPALDPTMVRMRARVSLRSARVLFLENDLSGCFQVAEGWRLARAVGSQVNMQQAQRLAGELVKRRPQDGRVQELAREILPLAPGPLTRQTPDAGPVTPAPERRTPRERRRALVASAEVA